MHPPADEIRAVLGPGTVEVTPLAHTVVASATAGLWRVRSGDRTAVVKLLAHDPAAEGNWRSGTDPAHWYYWRREADAYASGVLAGLTGGLRAPACPLVAERDDGSVAVWLEDLAPATPAPRWPLPRYRTAARHLGRAQGAFVAGTLPPDPWLSRGWLRQYVARRDADAALPDVWSHPLLAPWFPDPAPVAAGLRSMRESQPRYLAILDQLPATLCHLDLHPANLFAAGDATVAIDWAFAGVGAVGEDPGNLVPDAALDFHVPPGALDDLHELVVAGYHEGLAADVVDLTVDDVRTAMAAATAAKYAWIGPALLHAVAESRPMLNRRPLPEAVAAWAPTVHYLLAQAARV